ncbi:glycosyltransferase [Pseudohaliea rubra]|uniref:Glycosyltransferase n=1 Tax=Pseudohaliea rubra DSM 19751 TaxID=1265313 RepID=A0A095WVR6_9GAMM|nr:glycosyltransferase [Pseudohaliea rubra]KGE02739.1 Glycosyltransferase [Pseudohaliea rubra DSM 19751]
MNIALFTNTFTPHVGGVARSVAAFRDEFRRAGHRTLVVAPTFPAMPPEEDVVRVPALQNFNASDFSVALPLPKGLNATLEAFKPDVIHAQHPFLLGMTALRAARTFAVPLVFTHHTRYEEYTHYVPVDSPALNTFVIELATRYANLADRVIAPSESIRDLLVERGVTSPVQVIPTGVYVEHFARGNREAARRRWCLPAGAFVVGHMGRLAEEKNIGFLAAAVAGFLARDEGAYFLVVGSGDAEDALCAPFRAAGLENRLLCCGVLEGQALADALNAMDVFAFASQSETQGMVLTEAMAAGLPVVALDAPGAREVVRDGENGRLLTQAEQSVFADALRWVQARLETNGDALAGCARATAEAFSMKRSADKAIACYRELHRSSGAERVEQEDLWHQVRNRIRAELEILGSLTAAGDEALEGLQKPE